MADSNHDELLSQFTDITGATAERATFFLESANWQLQLALASFFENFDQPAAADNVRIDDVDEDEDGDAIGAASLPSFGASAEPSESAKSKKEKKKSQPKYNASGARIVTYNNLSLSDDDEDDEESGQAFYAGGSERSGQQVLGPPRKNPLKDYVSDIFKSAQESGAEVVENPHASSSSGSRSFGGTGYRLGQTNDDHVALPDARANRPQSIDPVILRLWRQGFTINEGELRTYDEKRNKEFLECIAKGQLPPELRQQGGNMVQVNMEDHRAEDFKPSASKVKPFAGKGHTLGSPTPTMKDDDGSVASSAVPIPSGSSGDNESNEKRASEELKVDANQPTTSIQIRLADGSRLSGRFNHSHTINDLRQFIITARPQYTAQTFSLLTTFPSKELADAEQTIESAGLLNAAIMQRMK